MLIMFIILWGTLSSKKAADYNSDQRKDLNNIFNPFSEVVPRINVNFSNLNHEKVQAKNDQNSDKKSIHFWRIKAVWANLDLP